MVDTDRTEVLHDLITRIEEAASGERNRDRGKKPPAISVGIEDPIAWTLLFDYDANQYLSDPFFYVEQTLHQRLWRFQHIEDDTPITLDMPASLGMYPEYTFVGLGLTYTPRGVPLIQEDHPITRDPDLSLLKPIDYRTAGWMPRALRWYEAVNEICDGRMQVSPVTWWRGCLDLAIQLRGYDNFILDTLDRPAFVHDLMKRLTEERLRWHDAHCRNYGQPLTAAAIGDDWINVPFISPGMFADFVLPRYLEIEQHHGAISGIHSCGNQAPVQKHLLQIRSLKAFEVSPWTDLTQTLSNVPADKHLGISVHPNDVLVATPAEMRARLRFIGDSCRGRSYSLGTSGLTPITDDHQEFLGRIQTWLAIAHEVLWQ